MDARGIIARARRGQPLDAQALGWFCRGLADGSVSDAQAGAFAMAVCLNGLAGPAPGGKAGGKAGAATARAALTAAMRDSGQVLRWDLPGPVVDKHSTGGVGDCTSLVLAPALAACGVYVPMISGRGLGHTGGTLDKLEAIAGVSTDVPLDRLRAIVAEVGCAIVGASADIAPADRRLYRVRDVTDTVDSIDLITASILSKKLAAGTDALILDIKTGAGAFMTRPDDARALGRALVGAADQAGCVCRALMTDMSQPLAPVLGNALEVGAAMRCLTGAAPDAAACRLYRLSVELGGELLDLAGAAPDVAAGRAMIAGALSGGRAAEIFGRMIHALGGPADFADRWAGYLPRAPLEEDVAAPHDGIVTALDGQALGRAVVALGGGRRTEADAIDPAVGLSRVVSLGESIARGAPLATIHAASRADLEAARRALLAAVTLSQAPAAPPDLVLERITP
ncbi:thymidine phosphorylase [Brevirhabdus sp.]|uniref:thymidine phosphorylase n=1 Tax=Brevirhabdus sp. TaxID=2004514 RepID=UPI00405940FA